MCEEVIQEDKAEVATVRVGSAKNQQSDEGKIRVRSLNVKVGDTQPISGVIALLDGRRPGKRPRLTRRIESSVSWPQSAASFVH